MINEDNYGNLFETIELPFEVVSLIVDPFSNGSRCFILDTAFNIWVGTDIGYNPKFEMVWEVALD